MIQFIIEILTRLKTEKPRFFIVLQWFVSILAVVSFSVGYVLNAYNYAPILQDILSHLTTSCIALTIGFQLPKKDV
jgi:hypothetical protein